MDRAEVVRYLAAGLTSTGEVEARIASLFTEGDDQARKVTCSSVHRIKGLEADRVFVLQDTLYPRGRGASLAAKRAGAEVEERNIEYVACTRAKRHLTWAHGLPE
jgi:superfamily I DNA/RNA helicase